MKKDKLPEKREREEVIYYQEDEIDLYELWLTLKKRWKVVFVTTLIFIFSAVGYILVAKPVYEAKAAIKIPYYYEIHNGEMEKIFLITDNEVKFLIEKLNQLIEQKEFTKLSKRLNIPVNISKCIIKISITDNRKNQDTILIKAEYCKKNSQLEHLIFPAIIEYLNNNPSLLEKINLKKETLKKSISAVDQKLKELISMKSLILKKLLKTDQNSIIAFNPFVIDKEILSLKLLLNELQYELENLKGFEISTAIFSDTPARPKKTLILVVAAASGIFSGIFLALFLEWIENAKRRHIVNT